MIGVNIIGVYKSGIKIKKSRRGLFTEYCGGEVTDKCILKAKKSKNPTLRKRATFALNARGWSKKHADGGNIAIEGAKTIGGYLPFIGTAIDAYELYKNPSWKQAGWTTLGLLTDIFTGGSARAVIKTARNLKNAKEALSIVRGPITKRIYKDAAVDAIKANTKAKKDVLRDASFNIGQNYVQYITDKYVKNNDNKQKDMLLYKLLKNI